MYICEMISSFICSLLHFSSFSLYSAKVARSAIDEKKIKELLYAPLFLNSLELTLAAIAWKRYQHPHSNTISEPIEILTYMTAIIVNITWSVFNANYDILIILSI